MKLSLQKKYSFVFSFIFLSAITYIVVTLFQSEKEDFARLSYDKFNTIFNSINILGEEALSVGDQDQLILNTIVHEMFKTGVVGLKKISFIDRQKRYFVYADIEGNDLSAQKVPDSLWQFLEKDIDTHIVGNEIHLSKKIIYETASKSIFLGYSQLIYSKDHIDKMIDEKLQHTIILGVLSFISSLFIIILVTALLIRRIRKLRYATKQLSEGNYLHLPVKGYDEVSELTHSFNNMTVAVKERLLMAKYVSESTIDKIKDTHLDMELGGKKESVCLFFSDIRGFTAFSEKNTPQTVVKYLNESLDLQVEIIKNKHEGDIDKFVGDEIMAVFRGKDKEHNATMAAVDVQKTLATLYKKKAVFKKLKVGIGIHAGVVISGNIGSKNRMDFTVIGDSVNTAARLCSAAKADEIVVSEHIMKKLNKKSIRFSEPFTLDLKNKENVINLYRVEY